MTPQDPTAAPAAPGPVAPLTHEAARARIEEIRGAALKDPRHPFVNTSYPNHQAAFSEFMHLNEIIAGLPPSADPSGIGAARPRLSADLQEAALGLTEPAFAEPDAIADRLALTGRPLAPELVPLARDISPRVPARMIGDVALALAELPKLQAELAQSTAPPRLEETEDLLEGEWGERYERQLDYASAAWDQLGPAAQQWITRAGIRLHPEFIKTMAVFGERFLDTDEGLRWRMKQPSRRQPVEAG